MAQTIKIRRTSTPGKKPVFNTDIVTGEFGLNTADGLLFIGDGAQTRTIITADNWVTGSLKLLNNTDKIHILDNGRLVLGTPTDELRAIAYYTAPSHIGIAQEDTPTKVYGPFTASNGGYITGSDLVLFDADLVASKNDAYAVNFYGTSSYVHTSSRLQVDSETEYYLGTDKLLRLASGDNVTLGYSQNAGPGVTVTINASGGDLTDLNNFTSSINDVTGSFLLNTTDTFTGTLTVAGTLNVNSGYYQSNSTPIMYYDTSGNGVANFGATSRTFKAVGSQVIMDQPITASGIPEFSDAEVGLGMGIVIKRDDNGALHTAPVATPRNIFYAADETGAPTGSDRFIIREDSQYAKFGKATPIGPATTTFGDNIWENPARTASGSHILVDGEPLTTNARYRAKGFRANLTGIGRSANGGGNSIFDLVPDNGIDEFGINTTILPPANQITAPGTVINGDLHIANAWLDVPHTGPIAGSTVLVSEYIYAYEGSPGILMGNGTLQFFASESISYDLSGSALLEPASASIEFAMASDSSSLLIRTGKGAAVVDALYISQSGRRPLIGIGTQDPKSALDIRDVKDDGTGTEFVLKTTRTGTGASVGDKAGTLNFTVESGSFNDYKTSGSVAVIDSEVTEVSALGVRGDLVLKTSATTKAAPKEVLRVSSTNSYFSSSLKVLQNLTIGSNTVLMTNIEETISGDSEQTFTTFASNDNDGAIYDYVLVDSSNGYARTGQFMVCHNGTTVSYTDTSTRAVGGDTSEPVLSALDPSLGIIAVRITNGDGYTFKSLRKLI